ncbi:Beta-1,4-mannooligosaccharide phosphorylase [Stieleria maiorica]|uniref:Beta-1,4-mannooligosaccharide phosphorylase n=1 Tax=Stieleria maiorica TaxID=2795974 RepID=A0A5B9MBB7_9BACT|nr:glycoside hydrolase family 130 protein [Stieleria maiorica]QEF97370.1 Beta-1,4-mannooligosaccharide phosphorylase [Stieleria maiorica]
MIQRLSESVLLCPADLRPSRDDFAVIGVFNPGVVQIRDEVVMLTRVAERPIAQRAGFTGLPRWESSGDCVVDWVHDDDLISVDPRVVRTKSEGLLRLTSVSHLRVFRKRAGSPEGWVPGPTLIPATALEEFGIEDPRITKIDQTYWITYVAVSRPGAATALASSDDMLTFKRHGLIFCPENKDVVLFPHKIDGQFVALHRPNPNSHFSQPQIWLARSPDLLHWGRHQPLLRGRTTWEADRVGGGTPPILIDEGWLHLYHGSQRARQGGRVGEYSVGALLLDRDDPSQVLARSQQPIMRPVAESERNGFVANVVFPTALIESNRDDHDDVLSVYYGATDTSIGVVAFSKRDILNAIH